MSSMEISSKGRITTFFFTNFPNGSQFDEFKKIFIHIGDVCDVFIPRKMDRFGKPFGFVRFRGVQDVWVLEEKLNNVRMGDRPLKANVAKFERRRKGESNFVQRHGEIKEAEFKSRGSNFSSLTKCQNEKAGLEDACKRLLEIKYEFEECLDKFNKRLLSCSQWLCLNCISKGALYVEEMESKNLKPNTPDRAGEMEKGIMGKMLSEQHCEVDRNNVSNSHPNLLSVSRIENSKELIPEKTVENTHEQQSSEKSITDNSEEDSVDHRLVSCVGKCSRRSEAFRFGEFMMKRKYFLRGKSNKKKRGGVRKVKKRTNKKTLEFCSMENCPEKSNEEKSSTEKENNGSGGEEEMRDRQVRIVNIRSVYEIIGVKEGETIGIVDRRLKEY